MTFAEQLAADAGQPTAKLTTNFIDDINGAFEQLVFMRKMLHEQNGSVLNAKADLDDVERDAISNGLNLGKNAEERAAKLAQIVAPQKMAYHDAKRNQMLAELDYQIAADYVHQLQMILDVFKVGIVSPMTPRITTINEDKIDIPF